MQIPHGQFFLEIFAGKAGLSQAISARGMAILPPIEIEAGEFVRQSVDVLDPQVQAHLKMLIEAKIIFYIHFGTPCSSFSVARKNDGGPPPLRDRHHLWGLPGLRPQDQKKVTMGHAADFGVGSDASNSDDHAGHVQVRLSSQEADIDPGGFLLAGSRQDLQHG